MRLYKWWPHLHFDVILALVSGRVCCQVNCWLFNVHHQEDQLQARWKFSSCLRCLPSPLSYSCTCSCRALQVMFVCTVDPLPRLSCCWSLPGTRTCSSSPGQPSRSSWPPQLKTSPLLSLRCVTPRWSSDLQHLFSASFCPQQRSCQTISSTCSTAWLTHSSLRCWFMVLPSGKVHLLPALCEAKFILCAMMRPLFPLYDGPYRVIGLFSHFFPLAIGRKEDSVTVARLKPLLASGLVQPAQHHHGRSPCQESPLAPARRRGHPHKDLP